MNVTIDTQAPTLVIAYDRDVTQNITFTFSDPIATQLIGAEVTVVNLTTPGAVPASSLTYAGAVATKDYATFFADGRYKVSVVANAVTDAAGNNSAAATYNFSQLAGDADNSGTVDFQDLVILAPELWHVRQDVLARELRLRRERQCRFRRPRHPGAKVQRLAPGTRGGHLRAARVGDHARRQRR